MGRRQHTAILALGRSPYEAPEGSALADSNRRQEAVRQVGAPVQMYDARGHPVNPDSRQRARAVRRANNDVLRTFGVVVSSQSTREETAKEQRDDLTVGNLSWENYVGLGMSTTDLLVMFVSMWWMVSLRANFETFNFRSLTTSSFLEIVRAIYRSNSLLSFCFAGLPAHVATFSINLFRNNILGWLFEVLTIYITTMRITTLTPDAIRKSMVPFEYLCQGAFFVLAAQGHMFCSLQSLHLISPSQFPALRSLIPFSHKSPIILSSQFAASSPLWLWRSAMGLLTTPFTMACLNILLRPRIEAQLYRLLRRRLPNPQNPDDLSFRAAAADTLNDGTIPGIGDTPEYQKRRSMTLWQDLTFEIRQLWDHPRQFLGLGNNQIVRDRWSGVEELDAVKLSSIVNFARGVQTRIRELGYVMPSHTLAMVSAWKAHQELRCIRFHPIVPYTLIVDQNLRAVSDGRQEIPWPSFEQFISWSHILSGDVARENYEQARESVIRMQPVDEPPPEMPAAMRQRIEDAANRGRNQENSAAGRGGSQTANTRHLPSRSNTLFSGPVSPATSPPTSPRIRASLIHQTPEIVTMQLEVLHSLNRQQADIRETDTPSQPTGTEGVQAEVVQAEVASVVLDIDAPGPTPAVRTTSHIEAHPDTVTHGLPNIDTQISIAASTEQVADDARTRRSSAPSPPVTRQLTTTSELADEPIEIVASPISTRTPSRSSSLNRILVEDDAVGGQNAQVAAEPEDFWPSVYDEYVAIEPPRDVDDEANDQQENESRVLRRVTVLSAYPVESLASHLSSFVVTVLFLPLETSYLRALAAGYLQSASHDSDGLPWFGIQPTLPYADLSATLRPVSSFGSSALGLFSLGLGLARAGFNRQDAASRELLRNQMTYTRNLTLLMTAHACISGGLWALGTMCAFRLGQRLFGWRSE